MRRRHAALLFPIVFFGLQIWAQQFATLNATVFDPTGGVVPKAQVTVRNTDTDAKRGEMTNGAAIATIPSLPQVITSSLLTPINSAPTRSSLTLTVGQVTSLNVTLRIKTAQVDHLFRKP